jgi:hypothetical protein
MEASLLYGGITHHYIASKLNYCNKINNYGTIHNEYVIGMVGSKKFKAGFIKGTDSACGSIFGPLASYSIYKNLELIVGGYNTNFDAFNARGIKPMAIGSITPIIGLDYRIFVYKNLSIDTLVSYGVISHSLRVDF